ncbi:MAG: hypothetical protein C0514_00230 [Candidatus Puniceispirillum sp.]|nr:hypothetical protein [Candidatus Puniceispirillum sp.]
MRFSFSLALSMVFVSFSSFASSQHEPSLFVDEEPVMSSFLPASSPFDIDHFLNTQQGGVPLPAQDVTGVPSDLFSEEVFFASFLSPSNYPPTWSPESFPLGDDETQDSGEEEVPIHVSQACPSQSVHASRRPKKAHLYRASTVERQEAQAKARALFTHFEKTGDDAPVGKKDEAILQKTLAVASGFKPSVSNKYKLLSYAAQLALRLGHDKTAMVCITAIKEAPGKYVTGIARERAEAVEAILLVKELENKKK